MTQTAILSQPEPAHIARATLALARVLAGSPDLDTRLAAGAALARLSDVHPPYPPHPFELTPLDPDDGIAAALTALREDDRSSSPEQAVRVGLAARELRQLQRTSGSRS